jgi:trehalose/maltose transport system permease protein
MTAVSDQVSTAGGAPARRRQRRSHSPEAQDRRFGYALVAPVVIVLLAITAYPLFYNVWNSFHHDYKLDPVSVGTFAGLSNYKKIFQSSPLLPPPFVPTLARTLGFMVVSVTIELVIGLALAVVLDQKFRGRALVRVAIFIPWAVPTVVSAELWRTFFDPQSGFVNYVLSQLHLPLAHTTWLSEQWTAWAAILAADAWRNVPFMAIVLLAGLQVIPRDIYEASRVDGASAWQSFWRLTIPLLKPALMVALIFRTLQAFLIFDVVYIMTGGGPADSTSVLSYLDWRAFLVETDYGYGGAVSVALIIMALVIAAIYVRVFQTDYEVTQ